MHSKSYSDGNNLMTCSTCNSGIIGRAKKIISMLMLIVMSICTLNFQWLMEEGWSCSGSVLVSIAFFLIGLWVGLEFTEHAIHTDRHLATDEVEA